MFVYFFSVQHSRLRVLNVLGYPDPERTLKYDDSRTIDLDNLQLAPDEYLIKVLVLSIDPFMRSRMRDPSDPDFKVSTLCTDRPRAVRSRVSMSLGGNQLRAWRTVRVQCFTLRTSGLTNIVATFTCSELLVSVWELCCNQRTRILKSVNMFMASCVRTTPLLCPSMANAVVMCNSI